MARFKVYPNSTKPNLRTSTVHNDATVAPLSNKHVLLASGRERLSIFICLKFKVVIHH